MYLEKSLWFLHYFQLVYCIAGNIDGNYSFLNMKQFGGLNFDEKGWASSVLGEELS